VKPSRSEAVRLNSQERSSGSPPGRGQGVDLLGLVFGCFGVWFSLLDTLGIKVGKKSGFFLL